MFIEGKFITLNKYINTFNKNRYAANKIKQDMTNLVKIQCMNKEKMETPVRLKFIWHVKNKRTDPDNIAFSKKWVCDGMVKAKIIPDDTMKHIIGFIDEFKVSEKEGVEVVKV